VKSIQGRLRTVLKTALFSAAVTFAGCGILREDPMLQRNVESPFKPAISSSSSVLSNPKALQVSGPGLEPIQGPDINPSTGTVSATKALSRDSRLVLGGEPAPPSPETINQLGDQLITALESNKPVSPSLLNVAQNEGAASDPWTPDTEGKPAQVSPALPERLESSNPVGASEVTEFPANREWTTKQAAEEARRLEGAAKEEASTTPPVTNLGTAPLQATDIPSESEGSYRMGPGDGVDVTVWEMPELSRALVIRPDGFISFPLIREIKAAGQTPADLEAKIQEALSEHLIDPEVNVVVTSVGSKSYYVFGAVASPGVYPHFRQTTLLQGIITAGGFPSVFRAGQPVQHGDLSRVRIIRTHDNGREIITKNLKGLKDREVISEDIALQPEDIVYVPQEAKLVYVFGEVLAPGVVPITDGTRILEAILGAGGVRPTAKRDQIVLIRPATGVPTYACVSMKEIERGQLTSNIELQSGDIIYVPQKFIAKVAEFVQLYSSAIQPALETYLTSWDAWFVHERFSALRSSNWGLTTNNTGTGTTVNPDP
jgi:polysaccharide biosynthesis/export protein